VTRTAPARRPGRPATLPAWLATVFGVLLLVAPGIVSPGLAEPVRAATPDVTLTTATTYDVLPDENRVAVTVQITATSHRRDTVTRRYYVDRAYLAVMPGTSSFKLSGGSGTPTVSVSARRSSGPVLLLNFGFHLGSGKSTVLKLTFNLADPGGAPDRALRISPSLVAFQAWAYGSDGVAGSTVRVRIPAAYAVTVGRGPLAGPAQEPDGRLAYTSDSLPTPGTFIADILADRPGVLVESRRPVAFDHGSGLLLVRSWPDDPAWRKRVGDLLAQALPVLDAAIGVAWPADEALTVRETLSLAAIGGHSGPDGAGGGFDPAARRLDVPYTADPTTILHGAAHAWFNGRLVADRWIAEGFASLYAEQAGQAIDVPVVSPALTVAALGHKVPLNAWLPGSVADDFGYAASLALAGSIADWAGEAALAEVWRAADRGEGAYQPPGGTPELGAAPPDWRGLLDLLEEKTGRSFEGFWRAWVVRPADAPQLDARGAARARYRALLAEAGAWTLPRSIRDALRDWRFEDAGQLMDSAANVLGQRAVLNRRAVAAGMSLPPAVQRAFEGDTGLATAAAEATTELVIIGEVEKIAALRPSNPDIVTRVGLIDVRPDEDLAAAKAAFATGDLDATLRHANDARAAWRSAKEVGRNRLVSAALIGLTVLLFARLLLGRLRRRGARR
jgi:hypothetical protein